MDFFCTDLFKKEYEKLIKRNSYNDLESILCVLFSKTLYTEVISMRGSSLYGPEHLAFYKKRVFKPSEYRLYFVGDTEEEKIYCYFIHPKRGTLGYENININHQKKIHIDAMSLRKGELLEMYKVLVKEEKLAFLPISKEEILKKNKIYYNKK